MFVSNFCFSNGVDGVCVCVCVGGGELGEKGREAPSARWHGEWNDKQKLVLSMSVA